MEWYTRTYTCRNGITEKTKFPVPEERGYSARKKESEAKRASRASDTAERAAARLLNNNFSEDDIHLVLEYTEEEYGKLERRAEERGTGGPLEDRVLKEADRDFVNWVRRVQRSAGPGAFIYLGVTSDMDGESLQPVRVHHHVVVNRTAAEICIKKWTAGYVWHDALYTVNGDFSALAEYMIKQVRYLRNRKRYVPSRFLAPAAVSKPVKVTRYGWSEMKAPRGAVVLYRAPYIRGQSQYIRYYMPRDGVRSGGLFR